MEALDFYEALDRIDVLVEERKAASEAGDSDRFIETFAEEKALREAVLSAQARKKLSSSDFVFPSEKRYPIHDRRHGANALARASGKPEYSKVKSKVCGKYPDLPACSGKD